MFLPEMFVNYSNNLCKETKFKRFRYTNAYVKNDILFNFSLKRLSIRKYTLEFGMNPLCRGIDSVDQGTFELNRLNPDFQGTLEINELWQYVTDEIIPFFNSCNTVQNTLHALQSLYQRMYLERTDYLRKNNIPDNGWPVEKTFFFDDDVFYLAMKAKDYESMNKSLSYKIPISQSKVELFRSESKKYAHQGDKINIGVYEAKTKREEARCEFLMTLRERVLQQDSAFFNDLIEERENISRTSLPKNLFS